MKISNENLWRLMKKIKLNKKELAKAADISKYTMAKMYKDKPVSLEAIMRLRKVFYCAIGDRIELIKVD